jgi:exodeoxyribonuclease VII large subunit
MPSPSLQPAGGHEPVIGVGELNRRARCALESAFPLLWVAGEISNLTHAASGHVYFSLKEEDAQVRCTMWRNRAQLLPFRLAHGMRVEVRALVTLYEPRGDYQLNVESVRQAGVGALYEAYARLKAKLQAEGLFDAARKRPLPVYPASIGVVTSLQAAALHDVLVTLRRRAPNLPVLIYPAPVQGADAARHLTGALQQAALRRECDVLILCRGGGSIEDLWAFNDEALARAIVASTIPVVCGIGHETDVTIADHVADQRAATPTAAAELVTAGYVAVGQKAFGLAQRLQAVIRRRIADAQQRVDLAAQRVVSPLERLARLKLSVAHARVRLNAAVARRLDSARRALERTALVLRHARPRTREARQTANHLGQRLYTGMRIAQDRRRDRIQALAEQLTLLDPGRVLGRGYAIVRDPAGRIVRDSRQTPAGCEIALQFAAGSARATVTESAYAGMVVTTPKSD